MTGPACDRGDDGGTDPGDSPLPGGPVVADDGELVRVLSAIQARGAIGRGPITDAIDHARDFVRALPWSMSVEPLGRLAVDLGSGGGLPGLVVAFDRPDVHLTLVERRAKRADLLMYGVRSLGLGERVDVVCDDVTRLMDERPGAFDLVTARSFAAPQRVFEVASVLLATGGWLIVSEPPDDGPRWTDDELRELDLVDDGRHGRVRRLRRLSRAVPVSAPPG